MMKSLSRDLNQYLACWIHLSSFSKLYKVIVSINCSTGFSLFWFLLWPRVTFFLRVITVYRLLKLLYCFYSCRSTRTKGSFNKIPTFSFSFAYGWNVKTESLKIWLKTFSFLLRQEVFHLWFHVPRVHQVQWLARLHSVSAKLQQRETSVSVYRLKTSRVLNIPGLANWQTEKSFNSRRRIRADAFWSWSSDDRGAATPGFECNCQIFHQLVKI